MKNLKIGNILVIAVLLLIPLYLYLGGLETIKETVKEITSYDLEKEFAEFKKETQRHDSINNLYAQKSRKHRGELIDSLIHIKKENVKLKDSIKSLHISYMNDSYLKAHHDTNSTYWFVNYSYRTWELKDGKKGRQTKWYNNQIYKIDGELSFLQIKNKICEKYKLDRHENLLVIEFFHQVSEKEYYKYLNE